MVKHLDERQSIRRLNLKDGIHQIFVFFGTARFKLDHAFDDFLAYFQMVTASKWCSSVNKFIE